MDTESIKTLVLKVLDDAFLMSLATVDENGVWAANVIFVYEDFNLYWLSLPSARHSRAIEKNAKIACTITASWATNAERALQIEGVAEKLGTSSLELERKLETKRGKEVPKVAGEILKDGHAWYVLRPIRVELIYSESFGYERKSVSL